MPSEPKCIGNRNLCGEPVAAGAYCAKHDPTRWSSRLSMHINGGATHSRMVWAVLYQGRETGMQLVKATNGKRGGYRLTEHFLVNAAGESIDLTTAKSADRKAWLESQLDKPGSARWAAPPAPEGTDGK